ncbi:MAG: PP2C family protein-serine/threonine phosphatase [Terriglobia bacterium]
MNFSEQYSLACLEIWGGNRQVAREVTLPGLQAWVYSEPLRGSTGGGDVYYLSACSQGQLARIGLADVSGHGEKVSRAAARLRALMEKHINTFDQSEFAHELNEAFGEQSPGGRFATVILLGVYGKTGELIFTNGGHPPPLWYRARLRKWELLDEPTPQAATDASDLPLGVIPGTHYRQISIRLTARDQVVLYTDALSEAHSPAGKVLEPEGLLELIRNVPVDSPEATGRAVIAAVRTYRGGAAPKDDETLLALQRPAA